MKKIVKKKHKSKLRRYSSSSSSSSSDERIINHKKKKHHKRYIHNIEEVEIIEEHTFNKKKKKIYRKVPGTDEFVSVSSSEGEGVKSPRYVVSKTKRMKRKSKEGKSSSSSSSDEERVKSPGSDATYHTEYHYDVTKEKDDDAFTKTYVETELSPTRRRTKHRTYKETIQEDKSKGNKYTGLAK